MAKFNEDKYGFNWQEELEELKDAYDSGNDESEDETTLPQNKLFERDDRVHVSARAAGVIQYRLITISTQYELFIIVEQTILIDTLRSRVLVTQQVHTLFYAGSNPVSATNKHVTERLGSGLQNHLNGFDSHRAFQKNSRV